MRNGHIAGHALFTINEAWLSGPQYAGYEVARSRASADVARRSPLEVVGQRRRKRRRC